MKLPTPKAYRRVAKMARAELIEALTRPQRGGVLTIIIAEIDMRLEKCKKATP